jgi:AraC-like DNA-binding protein
MRPADERAYFGEGGVLPTVRAVSLTSFVEVARFVGLDPYAMLRRARIAPDSLDDPETRLPAGAVVDLITACVEESGCASFGLLLVECRTFSSLGAVSLLLEHQPNVRAMIEAEIRFKRHVSDILVLAIEDDGESAIIRAGVIDEAVHPQVVEYTVAITCRTLSEVSRGCWYPDAIHFTHASPNDLTDHRRILQCPLIFDAAFSGMTCRSALLDVPNPRVEPMMARYAEQLMGLVPLPSPESSVAERTRHAIHLLMPDGQASVGQVAAHLGVHPRRLQRLLEKEGQSFAALTNEVRCEFVLHHMGSPRHSIAAVSELAGYSSQSAFTRWFAREFGESPATWRSGEQHTDAARRARAA